MSIALHEEYRKVINLSDSLIVPCTDTSLCRKHKDLIAIKTILGPPEGFSDIILGGKEGDTRLHWTPQFLASQPARLLYSVHRCQAGRAMPVKGS